MISKILIKLFIIMLHLLEADSGEVDKLRHLKKNKMKMVQVDNVFLIDRDFTVNGVKLSRDELVELYKQNGIAVNSFSHIEYKGFDKKYFYGLSLHNNDKVGYTLVELRVDNVNEREVKKFIEYFNSHFSSVKVNETQFEGWDYWIVEAENSKYTVRFNNRDKSLNIFIEKNYKEFVEYEQVRIGETHVDMLF